MSLFRGKQHISSESTEEKDVAVHQHGLILR